MTDLSAALADYDLVQMHRIFLGRDAASEADLAGRRGRSLAEVLRELAGSGEFRLNVQAPLAQGRLPAVPARLLPAAGAAAWAATALPVAYAARAGLSAARTWPDLYARLFGDREFAREIEGFNPAAASDAFAQACAELAGRLGGRALAGSVDSWGREETLGWALDRLDPETPTALELWCEGRRAGGTATRLFRRDLQDALGGPGRYGFSFSAAEGSAPALPFGAEVEVRDARSGVVIASSRLEGAPEAGAIDAFRRDVEQAAIALSWLGRRAGELAAAAVFPLAEYDGWARAYDVETPRAERERARAAQTLAAGATITVLVSPAERALDHQPLLGALERQELPGWDAVLAAPPDQTDALASLAAALAPGVRERVRVVGCSDGDLAPLLGQGRGDHVLLLEGGDTLAPDALFRLRRALEAVPAPALVFGDDDVFAEPAWGVEPIRSAPRLRTAFDPELPLQTAEALGPVVLVRRRELELALAAGGSLALERRHDLQLRVLEAGGAAVHAGVRLASLRAGGPADRLRLRDGEDARRVLLSDVDAHLRRLGSAAVAGPSDDPLRPEAPRPLLRIAHPLPQGASATVIIPTRDRWDLLGPCLDGLERDRRVNATSMDVVVVDNGSQDARCLAELAAREADGRIRLLRSDAPFNFAALINLAAETSRADLLVMLNNDVEVLTPGWLDALARHALRPEVGAVGARLVYGDLTIQHAGVVTGGVHALTEHEGVGEPAAGGGYLLRHATTRRVAAVTGACLATRTEVWRRLGGLDAARFAVDGNDIDYAMRVWEAGLAVIYTPDATLFHHESKSRGFNARSQAARVRGEAEAERLRARWGERLAHDPWYPPAFDRAARPFQRLGPPLRQPGRRR